MRLPVALAVALGIAAPAYAQVQAPSAAFTPTPDGRAFVAWTPPAPPPPAVGDAYGPNPDGLVLANGQTVRCKLKRKKDRYYGGHIVWRVCWVD